MIKFLCNRIVTLLFCLSVCMCSPLLIRAQDYYWISFTNKSNTPYSLSAPEEYLSARAIMRRIKQNIAIDSLDLPVNSEYIQQVLEKGVSLVHASKWLNGITVRADSSFFADSILQMPFVKEIMLTKPASGNKSAKNKFYISDITPDSLPIDTSYYGQSVLQVGQLNGQYLHNLGFRGEGMQIAVLDGGFLNADIYPAFDSLWFDNRVLGTKDFVEPDSDFYNTNYHGMSVLSCMAGNIPGELIGTAPDASYWLIRSEDVATEYIIEEDNWVVAAEFADSVGADIINSSLGYSEFDDEAMDHTYEDMNGKTTRVTRAANIAASRGMLVFNSAGNEGDDAWKYIVAPADGDNVIAVGAVDANEEAAFFTSYGPASDGDVKPNIAAMGRNTYMQRTTGLGYANGTSFAAPVMAGMGACLWQANPDATAARIKSAIEQSADLYPDYSPLTGYGIPDMKLADQILKILYTPDYKKDQKWKVFPNPVQDFLVLQSRDLNFTGTISVSFYTAEGRLLFRERKTASHKLAIRKLQSLPPGLIILEIKSGDSFETFKLNKMR